MELKLQKWGNSNAIRIPNNILKSLGLKSNDKVILKEENEKIIIYKAQEKISLEERFKEYNGKNLAKEYSWDESIGKEIW